jgi:hypothetical protein
MGPRRADFDRLRRGRDMRDSGAQSSGQRSAPGRRGDPLGSAAPGSDPAGRGVKEPPIGIEPMTYSLLPGGRTTLSSCLQTFRQRWLFGRFWRARSTRRSTWPGRATKPIAEHEEPGGVIGSRLAEGHPEGTRSGLDAIRNRANAPARGRRLGGEAVCGRRASSHWSLLQRPCLQTRSLSGGKARVSSRGA